MEYDSVVFTTSDGIHTSLMGSTQIHEQPIPGKTHEIIFVEVLPMPKNKWWQTAWNTLNTDIFELWRLYGPSSTR